MLIEVVITIFLSSLVVLAAYFAPAIKLWMEVRARNGEHLRLEIVTFVNAGRQIYTDHEQLIAYVISMIRKQYPKLDVDYITGHILTALEWLEKGEVTIYTRGVNK